MSKRAADIVISTPASKVRRRLNFGSPYTSRAAAPIVRVTKQQAWTNRPMNRKPRMYRMYRSPDVPRGCEGPCKVQSFESRHDVVHIGKVMCISDVTRGVGLTHRIGKRFCVKSVYVLGKIWMDENIKTKNHTNSVMFFLVRDRRPTDEPQYFGEVFNMFDHEPFTASVENMHKGRYHVLRKWPATITGGQYASIVRAPVPKFIWVDNFVDYNQPEVGKCGIHTETALTLYLACSHATNPDYAPLNIRVSLYDSVAN
ncbi:coat protein [Bhendi yellow vein India virus [India:Srinivaspur OYSK2:2006]]|nr:coat protein [Bhendi yellow vein India virus [India:Srinivaspur OYSK2:2006]]